MRCLWLTLADPEPATNGQLIYSRGLIEATRRGGADLCVVGLVRPEKAMVPSDASGLAWRLVDERRQSRRQRLLRSLPDVALRGCSPEMDRVLARTLSERDWDAIVFDSICSGWGLKAVLRHRARAHRRPKVVYLAHNHEITVARRIADAARGARRVLKEIDAFKVARLERRIIAEADLVASNTPEDRRTFIREATLCRAADTPVALLPPGYDGPRVPSRVIDARVPRRAVVVGSFDWPPKRISLERFLAAAAPVLQHRNVELQIVGAVEAAYLGSLRERYPSVAFVGPVDDVRPYHGGGPDRAGARPAGWVQAQGAGLRVQPHSDPVDADRLARHASPGRAQHRIVRQPRTPGGGCCRADRRLRRAESPADPRLRRLLDAVRLATDRPASAALDRPARSARREAR